MFYSESDIAEVQLSIMQKHGIENWKEYDTALSMWSRRHWRHAETDQEIVAALSQWGILDWEHYDSLDMFFRWEEYLEVERDEYLSYDEFCAKIASLETLRKAVDEKITWELNRC